MQLDELTQREALFALLRMRPKGRTWSDIADEVGATRDAVGLLADVTLSDVLIPDPGVREVLAQVRREIAVWERTDDFSLVTVLDDDYPERLRAIRETPPFLFFRGRMAVSDRGMSVVGSRVASEAGLERSRVAADLLVQRGLAVISGLAAGIDATAHRAALDAGGRTVAFVGTGIQNYYPAANARLQDEVAERGLVASQFLPESPPTRHAFPMRNATMSGYGLATIIVEAGEHSGTRIQARVAVAHGRPVIVSEGVARNTLWGAALKSRPGVFVVSSTTELADAIDEVVQRESQLRDAVAGALGVRTLDLVAS